MAHVGLGLWILGLACKLRLLMITWAQKVGKIMAQNPLKQPKGQLFYILLGFREGLGLGIPLCVCVYVYVYVCVCACVHARA